MRILHITPGIDERVGGPAHVALGLCRALSRKGLETTLFTTNFSHNGQLDVPLEQPVQYNGVEAHFFPISYPRWYLYSPQLGQTLDQVCRQFDLIHIHGIWLYPTAIGGYFSRRHGVPYIIRPRGNLEPYALRQKWLKKRLYAWLVERQNLDRAAAIHFADEEELLGAQQFGFRSRAIIAPNGVSALSEEHLRSLKGLFRARYPVLRDKKVVLFLGRIHPVKGLDRLVWAFREVLEADPETCLVLAGPDNDGFASQVRRWLQKAGIERSVILTGHLSGDEKFSALVDADLFCLPSYQEAHSCALTEALMCGLPAVVTQEVKFRDLEAYSAGIRVNGGVKELANGLLKLLKDPDLRRQMGARARQLVLAKYTWDTVVETLIKSYDQIICSASIRR